MSTCPCCSQMEYDQCCEPLIRGVKNAETAEQLMRSRYTAYAKTEIDYLKETIHPDMRADFNKKEAISWSETAEWQKLDIVETVQGGAEDSEGTVEFIAYYSNKNTAQKHHELAQFKKESDRWYFFDGEFVKPSSVKRDGPKIGRNEPCPCGSGKKYKKCCG